MISWYCGGGPPTVMASICASSMLGGCGDALGRLFTFDLAMQRAVRREALSDSNHFSAQELQLSLDTFVADLAVLVEDEVRSRHRHDVGNGPRAQRARRELHRVHRLEPLRAAGGADQPDDGVVKVRRVTPPERM